ncbi:MAG: LysM peptidoglycan-binding domain-containing protein [Bacteroidota bacterium]
MKNILSILFLFVCFSIQGQGYKVVEKGGEKYYVHVVEAGNTLYAISKIYGVDVAYIEESNTQVADGLSIGEEILIPLKFRDRKFNKKPKPILKDDYIIHTVYKKETIYSISKHYRIGENDLLDANPSIESGLKRGQQIVIPLGLIKPAKESHLVSADDVNILKHKIEKGQTLYSVSKMYEIEVDELVEANPGLSGSNLEIGGFIVIPSKDEGDENFEEKDSLDIDFDRVQVKNIALLLPFEFKDLDSLGSNQSRRNAFAMIDLAIEFYRGAKIACERYTEAGGNVNLMVFDMKNEPGIVQECIDQKWLEDADVVIGPFHKKTFNELSEQLQGTKKILVSPNLKTASILKNRNVLKVNADRLNEIEHIAQYVAEQHHTENIVLVKSDIQRDQSLHKAMESRLNRYLLDYEERLFDEVQVVNVEEEGSSSRRKLVMQKQFYKDTNNVVIVPSNNLSFVSDALTKLNRVHAKEKNVQVYGFESWSSFDNIDVDYKQKFNLMLCATKNLDYDDRNVRDFMRSYFRAYETIPSDKGYAFLSYDVSSFLLRSLDDFGNKAYKNLDKVEFESIYQNIEVERTDNGSWTNKGFYFLQHKDFKLSKAGN